MINKFDDFDFDDWDEEEHNNIIGDYYGITYSNFFHLIGISKQKVVYRGNKAIKLEYVDGNGPKTKIPIKSWKEIYLVTEFTDKIKKDIETKFMNKENIEYYIPIDDNDIKDKIVSVIEFFENKYKK